MKHWIYLTMVCKLVQLNWVELNSKQITRVLWLKNWFIALNLLISVKWNQLTEQG